MASRFRSDSELSRLNAAAGTEVGVSVDLLEAIDVALAMAAATDGLVDPTVGLAMNRLGYDRDFADVRGGVDGELPPMGAVPGWRSVALDRPGRTVRLAENTALDLGATAKALAADRAATTISTQLGCGALVSLGGDVADRGPRSRRWIRRGHRRHLHRSAGHRGGQHLLGRSRDLRHRRAPLAPRAPPGAPHPRSGHGPPRRPLLAHCLGDRRQLRAGERRLDGGDHPRRARRRLAGASRASGAPRAARRHRGVHVGVAASPVGALPSGCAQLMPASLVATVGHGSAALWYLTRAAGLVSLILLSATVVLGTVASVGWTTNRWPRFLSQSVHRNLSLFCLALIGIHVVSTVGDGYVPIGLADAVIPFRSPYRPIWVGLGALTFDMLLAVALTSALRRRIGVAAWRGVHWLAYACWPIAVVHGLGAGSDARLPGATLVFVVCVGSVVAAVAWRLAVGRARSVTWRVGGAIGAAAVVVVIAVFAEVGPLRPGWSHRAGTSSALLAQLSGATSASYSGASADDAPDVPGGAVRDSRNPVLDVGFRDGDAVGPGRARPVRGHPDHAAGGHHRAAQGHHHRIGRERRRRDAPECRLLRVLDRTGDGTRWLRHRRRGQRALRFDQPDNEPLARSDGRHPDRPDVRERRTMSLTVREHDQERPRTGRRLLHGLSGATSDPTLKTHLERWGAMGHREPACSRSSPPADWWATGVPGSPSRPSGRRSPPGRAVVPWWSPTAPRASRPAGRMRSCSPTHPIWCSTASRSRPAL